MSSYQELVNQAKALMAQAEDVRKQELANVIADIKGKMKEFGITAADLGISGGSRKARTAKAPMVSTRCQSTHGGEIPRPEWRGLGRWPGS